MYEIKKKSLETATCILQSTAIFCSHKYTTSNSNCTCTHETSLINLIKWASWIQKQLQDNCRVSNKIFHNIPQNSLLKYFFKLPVDRDLKFEFGH